MEFHQCGRMNEDCTTPYEVLMQSRCTVGEFIEEINDIGWGQIRVDTMPFWYGGTLLGWYSDGELGADLNGKVYGEFDHSYDDRVVTSAHMVGGYSRYDFNLCIE